jgi:large subunit ribosomal protein L21
MFAVVQTSGRQYRVSEGDTITVSQLEAEVGTTVDLNKVLFVGGDSPSFGAPFVDGACVVAEVVSHDRGPKIDIFKYRRTRRYRKTIGFRAEQTTLRIQSISQN